MGAGGRHDQPTLAEMETRGPGSGWSGGHRVRCLAAAWLRWAIAPGRTACGSVLGGGGSFGSTRILPRVLRRDFPGLLDCGRGCSTLFHERFRQLSGSGRTGPGDRQARAARGASLMWSPFPRVRSSTIFAFHSNGMTRWTNLSSISETSPQAHTTSLLTPAN